MKWFPIVLLSFTCLYTTKATDIADRMIEGLPTKVLSSGEGYKVFEQYPWEGHSSNYGVTIDRVAFSLAPQKQ